MSMFISGSSTSTGSFHELHIADRVGIGTSTPLSLLSLSHGSNTNMIELERTSVSQKWAFLIQGASGNEFKIHNETANTDPFTIKTNGNIGIGETSPDEELHLKGAEPKFRIENSSDSGKYFNMHLASGGGVSKLRFDSETHTNTLLVTNNNRVGIGAGAPAVNLHIESSQTDTDFTNNSVVGGSSIIISNQQSLDNTFSSLQFIAKETGGNDQSAAIVVESTSATTYSPKLHIVQRTASNTQSTRLTINESGHVGIGTTDPTGQTGCGSLHIYGNHNSNNTILKIEQDGGSSNRETPIKS